jgi:hypothetical protein
MIKEYPTQEKLRTLFIDMGTHLERKSLARGRDISPKKDGEYGRMVIEGERYQSHILIWIYRHGEIPDGLLVDHRDGVKSNNVDSNLRLATTSQNAQNKKRATKNALGKNIKWEEARNKFRVYVDNKYIGRYSTLEDARLAAADARGSAHGEFARHD